MRKYLFEDMRRTLRIAVSLVVACYLAGLIVVFASGDTDSIGWLLVAMIVSAASAAATRMYLTYGTRMVQARAGDRTVSVELVDPGQGLPNDTVAEITEFCLYILRSGTLPNWREALIRAGSNPELPVSEKTAPSAVSRPATPTVPLVTTPVAPPTEEDVTASFDDDEPAVALATMCAYCTDVPATTHVDDHGDLVPVCQVCAAKKQPGKQDSPAKALSVVS